LPLTSGDVWSNIAYGRLIAAGHSPFAAGPALLPLDDDVRALVDPSWLNVAMIKGPLIGFACRALALTHTAAGDLVLFKLAMFAAGLATIAMAAAAARGRFRDDDARARFVMFAWCPMFAWEISGQAHNDALLLVALMGFAWAATRRRELAAIVCLAVGTAVKLVAAPVAAIYLVYIARTRPLRALALACVFAALCVLTILPWWTGLDTFSALWDHVAVEGPRTSHSLAGLLVWCAAPLGAAAQRIAVNGVVLVGVVLCALIGWAAIRRARTPAHVIHYSLLLFLCADVVALAWFQPWYVLWALPLAFVHPDRRWLVLTATYACLALVAYAAPYDLVNVIVDVVVGSWIIALLRSRREPATGARAP
jgi:hypothetical protein